MCMADPTFTHEHLIHVCECACAPQINLHFQRLLVESPHSLCFHVNYHMYQPHRAITRYIQGGSNMTGTDLCVNKPQSVPVIFEPPCTMISVNFYTIL
jgi:hypothetical protein